MGIKENKEKMEGRESKETMKIKEEKGDNGEKIRVRKE